MLKGEGYNKSADWWSVGILVYDMLTGNVCIFIPFNLFIYLLNICLSTFPLYICLFQPPFKSGNNGTLQKKILTDKLRMPPYFSPEVTSFLKKVICEIPTLFK